MSSPREIPQADMLWDTNLDKLLMDLFIKKAKRIDLDRTIIATGIIVLVAEEFNYQSGSRYSVGEILRRINDLKERYRAFNVFKSIDGVTFHIPSLRFTIGHAYYMAVGLVSENPQHTHFRLLGEPLYEELSGVFLGRGLGSIDLKWVYAYYTGDVAAMIEMPFSAYMSERIVKQC